jgi:hypothetical protein
MYERCEVGVLRCGMIGGQGGLGQVFLRVLPFCPVNIITARLSTFICRLGDKK